MLVGCWLVGWWVGGVAASQRMAWCWGLLRQAGCPTAVILLVGKAVGSLGWFVGRSADRCRPRSDLGLPCSVLVSGDLIQGGSWVCLVHLGSAKG